MSGFLIDQLERLKTAKAEELLRADRLEDGMAANIAPPPAIPDHPIKTVRDRNGTFKVTAPKP
ncbi:hypothetical protein EOA13_24825 [Mesorhizobium sp. M7A.F.Ca.US.011.01.1.1]|uniref:hypothetical protein n=1 Tax=Mesorhizobium sp. M7A.F.Ca.US.011.01.1.1 TaxID=2496741 RepID=UPI000FCC8FBB|nr:hypothetical protein [Mesorhizobium sp. M7A.F.Ca.US.011.01.1.1]RUX26131.1 hypothetical protein EOA13_24825 [Mesorhizobium sp. M7A.F.Ca.US.011.01.1.1]